MSATHTHTGYRASIGYTHHSVTGYMHNAPRAGRTHAMNAVAGGYLAVCGVRVAADSHDHRCGERNPIELATAGRRVTCKGCLRRKPVAVAAPKKVKHVVMLETRDEPRVRWASDPSRRWCEQYAADIAAAGSASVTHPAGHVLRAWVETVEE